MPDKLPTREEAADLLQHILAKAAQGLVTMDHPACGRMLALLDALFDELKIARQCIGGKGGCSDAAAYCEHHTPEEVTMIALLKRAEAAEERIAALEMENAELRKWTP